MAFRVYHIVSILIMVVLPCSSCYGGSEHFDRKSTKSDHSLPFLHMSADHIDLYRYGGRGTQSGRALLADNKSFSVADYGAKGDGKSDDAQAFLKAWKEACTSGAMLLVPRNRKYLLKPITFSGPCRSGVTIQVYGTILASNYRSDYQKDTTKWLVFDGIDNLVVEGGGSIDGNGKIWWENSCKINKNLPCKHAPTAVTFYACKNLVVRNLEIQNAQQMHVSFEKCNNVTASGLKVMAPEDSPNTDGIHITNTQNILVTSTIIGTGDDCISIEDGSHAVKAIDITCGPGHGISIGSLGDGNSEAHVSNIVVNKATLSGTTNGLRIKTWQGGSGVASNIKFQNINLYNVTNPIIIDQNYCDQDEPCKKQDSAVQVRDVVYQNIRGTSSSEPAVVFNCSESYPCQGITMQNVRIQSNNGRGKGTQVICNNVRVSKIGTVSPQCSAD